MNCSMSCRLILGIFMLSSLFGCRSVEHYLYKDLEMPLFDGLLKIEVRGTPNDYEVKNKRVTRYEKPYSVYFKFTTHQKNVSKLRISNVTLIGKDTGGITLLQAREQLKSSKHPYEKEEVNSIFVRVGHLDETKNLQYEPFTLKAKVWVYRDNDQIDEQDVEVTLEPDFKKTRRSDWFDGVMSR
jgi:hypothetical protein